MHCCHMPSTHICIYSTVAVNCTNKKQGNEYLAIVFTSTASVRAGVGIGMRMCIKYAYYIGVMAQEWSYIYI